MALVPPLPRVRGALRAAAGDFYFNSWRLVPANLIWGAVLVALVALVLLAGWAFLPLLPLLAVPAAGLYRMAALAARAETLRFSDFIDGMRRFARPALALGAAATGIALVLAVNVFSGLRAGGYGLVLAALAADGLVALAALAMLTLALLVDPLRAGTPLGALVRLAALVAVRRVGSALALVATATLLFLVSVAMLVTVLTIGAAFLALLTTRWTLPSADNLEGRATLPAHH